MIRRAKPEDTLAIAELLKNSFDSRLADFMVYAQHGIAEFLKTAIELPATGPPRNFLIFDDPGIGLLGFAEFRRGPDVESFLSYICVSPHARRRGIALELIRAFGEDSKAKRLQLDVFADNLAARSLYQKIGFTEIGTTEWYVKHLPEAGSTTELALSNGIEAAAMYSLHGFCRFEGMWDRRPVTFGRIGPRTVRMFDRTLFEDDMLLRAIRGLFPATERALLVCPPDQHDSPDDAMLFQTSLRLSGSLHLERKN